MQSCLPLPAGTAEFMAARKGQWNIFIDYSILTDGTNILQIERSLNIAGLVKETANM